jgi:hypothetical protein
MINKMLTIFSQLCLISIIIGSGWATAHPYHSSFAEITWKESSVASSNKNIISNENDISNDISNDNNAPNKNKTSREGLSGTLQVALRVIPEDLESILSIVEKRTVILDDSQDTDKAIINYLWQFFRIRNETGKQLTMHWVGKDVKHSATWLYFEYPVNHSQSLTLENRVLMDYKETQINRASVNIHKKIISHTFTLQDQPKLIWGEN